MKRLFLFIIFIFFSCFNTAFCAVSVQSTGGTTVSSAQISTPIQMTVSDLLSLTLTVRVKAIDQYITNTTNSNYKIPVEQLYLKDGTNDFQMVYNTNVTVVNGISINVGGYTGNYNCIVKNTGVLPPGTYTTRLQFDTNTNLSPSSIIYTLSFTIPLSQSVSSVTNPVNITLTPNNVFDGTAESVENTTTPQIIVQSNGNWKLVLTTSNLGTLPANYYFLITSVSTHVTNYLTEQTKLEANRQYVLASGTATFTTPVTGTYTTDYINIKYFLKNTSGTYIPEGIYNNYLNYTIQNGET